MTFSILVYIVTISIDLIFKWCILIGITHSRILRHSIRHTEENRYPMSFVSMIIHGIFILFVQYYIKKIKQYDLFKIISWNKVHFVTYII